MTRKAPGLVRNKATSLRLLTQAGIVRPMGPRKLAGTASSRRKWGLGPAGGFAALAARSPNGIGLVDDLGELTFREINERGNALADSLAMLGVKAGGSVGIMCRNHRGFLDATLAAAKLGADVLFLNTAFAGPQLVEVVAREKPSVLIYDQEFRSSLEDIGDVAHVIAWSDEPIEGVATVEELIAKGVKTPPAPPSKSGRLIILTSGTTGTPKGAPRSEAGIDAAVALLSRIPLRRGSRTHVAAPLFHTWGLAHLLLAMLLETTIVVTRRFDPEGFLKVLTEKKCDAAVVIPVMLSRVLRLDEEILANYDLSKIRIIASSGSALPGDLALEWMDRFGDHIYNTYGSTEVAYATIANPDDLRQAPGTAGRPPLGAEVRLYDVDDKPAEPGESGRIFVGNGMLFEGYTGGGHKAVIDGLMSSGDVGRFDDDGRLFVEGRDDDMIVSGGENVFPQEIEDCLTRHELVAEAAAIGVDDEEFGKRLRAFVVPTGEVTDTELKEWVKTNLARYKVPREIVFLEELPRNATGKVLKGQLADWQD